MTGRDDYLFEGDLPDTESGTVSISNLDEDQGYLEPSDEPSRPVVARSRRRFPFRAAAAILIAAAACMFILAGLSMMSDEGHGTTERLYSNGDLSVTGDLAGDDFVISYSEGRYATITYIGGGDDIEWLYIDLCDSEFVEVNGTYQRRAFSHEYSPSLTIETMSKYEAILYVDGNVVAVGYIILGGTIHDTYEWSRTTGYETHYYSVDYSYSFSEYLKYAEDLATRHSVSNEDDDRFVVVDVALQRLSTMLEQEYLRVHGQDASLDGYDYADYLLSFVQCMFSYPATIGWSDGAYRNMSGGNADLFLYGEDEYWAYPMETVFHEMGDCEDTSILLCALYSAAGYTSAMVTLQGHMMAAVALSDYETDAYFSERYSFNWFYYSGMSMFVCETTFSSYVPVGYHARDTQINQGTIEYISVVEPGRWTSSVNEVNIIGSRSLTATSLVSTRLRRSPHHR